MFQPEKLIRKGLPKGHFKDLVVRSLLGGVTYLVVLIAALLFGKIIIDGARPSCSRRRPRSSISIS